MKIKIYCIGKIKENYLKEGIQEYISRITPFCSIEMIEVRDEPVKSENNNDVEQAKQIEGQRVIKLLKSNDYLIGLDLCKNQLKSPKFAEFLKQKLVDNGALVSFVIGGSYGLSSELKNRCNYSLCLSEMTFLHQMTRLILLEQIYRAFKILNNEVYHK